MKNKKTLIAIISAAVAVVIVATVVLVVLLSGEQTKKRDSIVIMTEELSMLFNPYYATSGTDMEVVGLTQIGMLSTDRNGNPVAGDDQSTVVKDFDYTIRQDEGGKTETVYTFVIKNGLKFSDGKPLTMNDVLFNMYEYLDPVYTGSSTMYSIKIKGLTEYRLQTENPTDDAENAMSEFINSKAIERLYQLIEVFQNDQAKQGTNSYHASKADMERYINECVISDGYKEAVANDEELLTFTEEDYKRILAADYDNVLEIFKKELQSDYKAAKEAFDFTTAPYSEWKDLLSSDVAKFLVFEGVITPVYNEIKGKVDRTKINDFSGKEILSGITTEEAAINKVYNDKVVTAFNEILTMWGTSGTVLTQYEAKARDIYLHNTTSGNELRIPNISGIVSLGHTTSTASVTVKGKSYTVAHEHNADGTVKNANEYDVLQVSVEGTDPKAIYSLGFTVAPAHYYSEGGTYSTKYGANAGKATTNIDIANNLFGVVWSSSDFQSKVIQSQRHVEVPVGAGAFMASDVNNSDNPKGSDFVSSNIVYYKANPNFMFPVKAPKLRLQVVSSSNAIDKLVSGEVDYVTPQFTKANAERLTQLEKQGITRLSSWQLGYGYIGVNAGKIPNIYVRRAIMAAMDTKLALEFYEQGTCFNIDYPMSMVSWAYPAENDTGALPKQSKLHDHTYMYFTTDAAAKEKIRSYMAQGGVTEGDAQLKITFTIAGSSITEHPTYPVFKKAAEILNDCGWNIEVKADSQALTKLSTGSLAVWAAAWGSTIDPDMYQVYHKNSTATSVYSWGYREIKADTSPYYHESDDRADAHKIIDALSDLIDQGRETMDQNTRKGIYEQALNCVLDLSVEMPVYQRSTLYAYNSKTIKGLNSNVNPYSSPLEKIWELEMVG